MYLLIESLIFLTKFVLQFSITSYMYIYVFAKVKFKITFD